jgi:hypothetical protein
MRSVSRIRSEEETGSSAFYTEEVGLHMSAETAVKTTT